MDVNLELAARRAKMEAARLQHVEDMHVQRTTGVTIIRCKRQDEPELEQPFIEDNRRRWTKHDLRRVAK